MTVIPGDALRYSAVDAASAHTSHGLLLLLAGPATDVLEIGAAGGAMTEALKARGCRVTAVEIDPVAAEKTRRFAEHTLVGDVERLDLAAALGERRFDAIVCGDVLEHLVDPGATLARLRPFLKPEGRLLVSIPNVAHGSVRLALLRGDFAYRETGLLDRTHLRFFTRRGARELVEGAGFAVEDLRRVHRDVFATEIQLEEGAFPAPLVAALRDDLDALTYQFVLRARAGSANGGARAAASAPSTVLEHLRAVEEARAAELATLRSSTTFKLAERLQRVASALLPPGSRRHRLLLWLLGARSAPPRPASPAAPAPSAATPSPTPARRVPFSERFDFLVASDVSEHEPNDEAFVQFATHAFPRIRARIPDARLVVLGAQPRAVHETLGRFGAVSILGRSREAAEAFDACRVLLALEGRDRRLDEAARRGLPAVVTPPFAARFTDGKDALLARSADEVVAKAIELHEDGALWQRIQEGALARAQGGTS